MGKLSGMEGRGIRKGEKKIQVNKLASLQTSSHIENEFTSKLNILNVKKLYCVILILSTGYFILQITFFMSRHVHKWIYLGYVGYYTGKNPYFQCVHLSLSTVILQRCCSLHELNIFFVFYAQERSMLLQISFSKFNLVNFVPNFYCYQSCLPHYLELILKFVLITILILHFMICNLYIIIANVCHTIYSK